MMARRFIAGRDAREATGAVERLRQSHRTFTLDLLGEAVTSESEALAYQQKYLDLIRDLSEISKNWKPDPQIDETPFDGALPRVNVSVKLSSCTPASTRWRPTRQPRPSRRACARS
jgi:RHH-type proline utilization regulon transcriptional repressor/proline dehydrogenase/delta 1-pyrroline-5-carboxylate dehydrogenase